MVLEKERPPGMGPSGGHGGVYPPSLSGSCHVPPDTSHGRSGRLGSCRVGWWDRLADRLPHGEHGRSTGAIGLAIRPRARPRIHTEQAFSFKCRIRLCGL